MVNPNRVCTKKPVSGRRQNLFDRQAKEEAMSDPVLRGSCLCKAVRYEVRPPFIRFAHCYCSRCRKATGGVRSTNIAVVPDQFRWVSGEELISRYDLPEARSFARQICKRCNCRCEGRPHHVDVLRPLGLRPALGQIGRASCRERV